MKRIGVIGSLNRDTITTAEGEVIEGFGGVLYSAVALAYLGRGEIETWLFCKIGSDVAAEAMAVLDSCPNVRREGIEIVPEANFHSQIRYFADGGKKERLSGKIEPLRLEDLDPFTAGLDGMLVNFITGFELEAETLQALRSGWRGTLVMDVHSLTLGRKPSGVRFWKRPDNWSTWVALADVVQMNEAEAGVLGGFAPSDEERLRQFAQHLLELGPRAVVLTRGEKGALGVYRGEFGDRTCEEPADQLELACEPTGCGDVFLAALGLGIVCDQALPRAMKGAVRAAGLKSRFKGVANLSRMADLNLF